MTFEYNCHNKKVFVEAKTRKRTQLTKQQGNKGNKKRREKGKRKKENRIFYLIP